MGRKKRSKKIKNNGLKNTIFIICLILMGVAIYYMKNPIKTMIEYNTEIKDKIDIEDDEKEEINSNQNIENDNEDSNTNNYNSFKKNKYYKLKNLERYIEYKNNNPSLSDEDVIIKVNIGLDYKFYTYINDADTSKDYKLLVNKYYKLGKDYAFNDLEEINSEYFINGNLYVRKLRKDAKEAFEKLSKDSIANGTPVYGQSGYRPYSMQESLYNNAVDSMGRDAADNDTARPGHSEHQTGLAIDVSSTKSGNMLNFINTDSYTWMKDNAHKYGFILRYTEGYENIHGFIFEPWHYRYVGVDIATDMYKNYPNMTYEEYYVRFIDK